MENQQRSLDSTTEGNSGLPSRTIFEQKRAYEKFSRDAVRSPFLQDLSKNNKSYRHILRFIGNVLMFVAFIFVTRYCFTISPWLGFTVYPFYLFFQGLLIAGMMIHSHELSHNHIRFRWINDLIGILSGSVSLINFYSFQYAHRLHHRNIGNIDAPESGAPVSLKGQKQIRNKDKFHRTQVKIFSYSQIAWYFTTWPLYIYYGDYSSWTLPFRERNTVNLKSLGVFLALFATNGALLWFFPAEYFWLYIVPVLIGGNRILAITFMHHAHEDSVFFSEEHHNFYNTIMATTDRDFGPIVNFFMLNNGYHIPHHLHPHIAYYDLKSASTHLQSQMPQGLKYNYYPKSGFYRECFKGRYQQRLDRDHEWFKIEFIRD